MKGSYLALLGTVVAFSAYQGSVGQNNIPAQPAPKSSGWTNNPGTSTKTARDLTSQSFPTLAGGMCRLTINSKPGLPCGTCTAICPASDLTHMIGDYFPSQPDDSPTYLSTHWNVPKRKQPNIHFVIASVPDPVHTHRALEFDRNIETIESAAQASGFLFARAWMPWDVSSHAESPDFTVRLAQQQYRDSLESLPGLLIFQKSGQIPSEILFVLIVGETPTGGLRLDQFQNALHIRRDILADSSPSLSEPKVLRIFGPGFSGSLRSLFDVLSTQPDRTEYNIFIRSGSVSSDRAITDFRVATSKIWPESLDFATFQYTDVEQEYYLSLFLNDREHLHSHIAVLSEDETAFGSQETQAKAPHGNERDEPCRTRPPTPCFSYIRLYFPRGIAQLRDAYQRNVKAETTLPGGLRSTPQESLPLSLSITGNDDDSVGPYSPLQTPLSEESVLQGIVSALRKQHARAVLIRAADPLDMIFLSRYLRQNYPQARLITVGADLLMVHEFYDPRFHGILALAPYPLLPGVAFPSRILLDADSQGVQRLFPDSYAVGGFDAMLSLLALKNDSKPAAVRLPSADYAQFGMPSFLLSRDKDPAWVPHLWLVTIGGDGYWPVAVLDEGSHFRPSVRDVDVPQSSHPSYFVHFSVGWTLWWMLIFGATLTLAFLVAYPPLLARSEILARFRLSYSSTRNALLFTGGLFLLAAQSIFVFPCIPWLGRFAHLGESAGWWQRANAGLDGLWLMGFGYLISMVLLGTAFYFGFHERKANQLSRAGALVCGVALIVVCLSTAWFWSRDVSPEFGSFLYRYIHIDSGVSPSIPIFCLLGAWIWWVWQSFTGIASTEEKDIVLPNPALFNELVPDACDRLRLKALASSPDRWPWENMSPIPGNKDIFIVALLGLLAILMLMRPSEIAEAFESTIYKATYWFLLYSCLFLVCYLATHVVVLWLEFRNLLRSIDRLPFRRGFTSLKRLTWKPLWKLSGSGRDQYFQVLGDEIDLLEQIGRIGPASGTLAKLSKEAKDATLTICEPYEKLMIAKAASIDLHDSFHNVQQRLANIAAAVLIRANAKWKEEDQGARSGQEPEGESNQKTVAVDPQAAGRETRVLERFLCLFYLNVILVPLRRLQTLILALAGVFVFVLMSYSSYPFESRESFHVLLVSIFFAISLLVGVIYGQMYSNPLLSLITNTNAGELGLDFWVKLGTFVFIPLLSILSVQFPALNNFLFSWLQPALQSVK